MLQPTAVHITPVYQLIRYRPVQPTCQSQKFWLSVYKEMRLILRCFPFSARIMLLCDFTATSLETWSEIATNLLSEATLLIAQKWKEDKPTLLTEWVGKVRHVFLLCKSLMEAHFYAGDMCAIDNVWRQWSIYVTSINKQGRDRQIRSQILGLL